MLNGRLNRPPLTRFVRVAAVMAMLGITLPIAGFRAAAETASAAFSGFVFDPSGATMSNVTVVLVPASAEPIVSPASRQPLRIRFNNARLVDVLNFISTAAGIRFTYDPAVTDRAITIRLDGVMLQQALDDILAANHLSYKVVDERSIFVFPDASKTTHEAVSDAGGYFQFVGLPAGEYFLEAQMLGFTTLRDGVTLSAGQTMQKNIALQLGSVEETITVRDTDAPRATSPPAAPRLPIPGRPCTASPTGGQILPPAKVRDVKPQYPLSLRDANGEAHVVLAARIGTDGFVKEAQAVSPVDPDVEDAAIAAVREWQFTPTFLNCVPVEVSMTVTVNFMPKQ